jgi:hypothetical protein
MTFLLIRLTGLELDCERKLQLPGSCTQRHTVDDAGILAAQARAINASVAWISRVDDVEEIERLHPELGLYAFVDGEGLTQ